MAKLKKNNETRFYERFKVVDQFGFHEEHSKEVINDSIIDEINRIILHEIAPNEKLVELYIVEVKDIQLNIKNMLNWIIPQPQIQVPVSAQELKDIAQGYIAEL